MSEKSEKSSEASLRASQVEARRRMDQFQHMTLVFQMCRPIWQRWLETALLSGRLSLAATRLYRADRASFAAVKWIPPKWEWVDPWKDRKAEELAQDNGWKSRSDIIEAEGYDPEEIDARIKADRDREEKLGLDFRPVEDKNLDPPIEQTAQNAA
jgi:lambda family phage portal protein